MEAINFLNMNEKWENVPCDCVFSKVWFEIYDLNSIRNHLRFDYEQWTSLDLLHLLENTFDRKRISANPMQL